MAQRAIGVVPRIIQDIKQTYAKNPQATQLNLQFMDITNLLPYMNVIGQFKRLRKLYLHGNKLKQLPVDLSMLKNIQQLDLTNNLDINIQHALNSLKTLPKLTHLKLQVNNKQKEQRIVGQLKGLKSFNNTKVVRQLIKKQPLLNILNDKVLTDFCNKIMRDFRNLVNTQIKYLQQDDQLNKQAQIQQDQIKFQKEIRFIASQSLQKLAATKDKASPSLQQLMLSTTKHQIYQILKLRSLNLCTDIYGDLGKCLKTVLQQQDRLFKSVLQQSLKLCHMEYQVKQAEQQRSKNIDVDPQQRFFNKLVTMQKQVKRLKKQKQQLLYDINQLQNDNNRYVDTLVKFSKGQKIGVIGSFGQFGNDNYLNNQNAHKSSKGNPNGAYKTSTHTYVKPVNQKQSRLSNQVNPNFSANYSTNGRNLTLKQLKDTIEEIYQSKIKFDQKNFDGKLPRQTMNQYIFTYLNQKYGLKSLTVQAANSIITGIQAYSAQDNDVAVFGKILRNQIDQQFRNVQSELKTTINDLLKMHIKAKHNYKSANEINQMHHEKVNGQISFQQCRDLVQYLYNREDANEIIQKLQLRFRLSTNRQKQETSTRRGYRDLRQKQQNTQSQHDKLKRKIKFSSFLQCVLDFQMRNHQKLLKPLIRVFKVQDRDLDGIVNQQQFINIIQGLCQQANEIISKLLNIVDPYETKSITFTQMVRLLANYPENNPVLGRFITNQGNEQAYQQQNDY